MYVPLHTVAQASLFTAPETRTDRASHALVPAALRERMHGRLHTGLRLFRVQEGAQLLLVCIRKRVAHAAE